MIKIISNMILCMLLNYHISCPFPAAQIRFPAVTDLLQPRRRAAVTAFHILWSLSLSMRDDTPYIVLHPVPDIQPLHTGKHRFAYSACMIHFRKVVNTQKIGLSENHCSVI
ncbi:hypothetical protein DTZ04_24290 [Escherichia coli]|nr:hypothetical protein [Escherichia coli]EGD4995703.1 hypothetical protein [Escherichia coli]